MPDRRRYGRTPDTVCLLAALAFVGAVLTITRQVPRSVEDLVPTWAGILWSAVFTVSAALALAGVLWRDHLTGWVLELSGRIGLACTATGYVLALIGSATQWGTAFVVAIVAAIAAGSVGRVVQLLRRLNNFQATILAQRTRRAD